jgi:hypothetical protein
MHRVVAAELLDGLPSTDPSAVASRRDLQRLNRIMGHPRILSNTFFREFSPTQYASRRLRLVELGAGDGTLLLHLARQWASVGVVARVTLVDRLDLVTPATRDGFTALGWTVETVAADVLEWLKSEGAPVDLILTNLFLHHFPERTLKAVLRRIAARTDRFIACEPCRSPLSLGAARCVGWIGCNLVTRHDAVVSVRAGFVEFELSARWPRESGWQLDERPAGWFSHSFVARRHG